MTRAGRERGDARKSKCQPSGTDPMNGVGRTKRSKQGNAVQKMLRIYS